MCVAPQHLRGLALVQIRRVFSLPNLYVVGIDTEFAGVLRVVLCSCRDSPKIHRDQEKQANDDA